MSAGEKTADFNFSELEIEGLKEIMNIGFGQAAAALSEVIDLHVVLSVPKIMVVQNEQLASFIETEIHDPIGYSVVEQYFLGKFSGTSYLLMPESEGRKLVEIFSPGAQNHGRSPDLDALEGDTILEVGNIIIGACVGKIAEFLGDIVSYQPPRFRRGDGAFNVDADTDITGESLALVFKTVFHFARKDITGLLFLVSSQESLRWMKHAINEFIQKFT